MPSIINKGLRQLYYQAKYTLRQKNVTQDKEGHFINI